MSPIPVRWCCGTIWAEDHRAATAVTVRLAAALLPGGLLAIDLMTERFAEARDLRHPHARVEPAFAERCRPKDS